jgi:hypothetical protein
MIYAALTYSSADNLVSDVVIREDEMGFVICYSVAYVSQCNSAYTIINNEANVWSD